MTETKSLTDAITWARSAEAGEYLARYADDGLTAGTDPGSRCGYSDEQLADVERVLAKRDLRLTADDRGLVATAVRS